MKSGENGCALRLGGSIVQVEADVEVVLKRWRGICGFVVIKIAA